MLSVDLLKRTLTYNPETGELRKVRDGKIIGHPNNLGYVRVWIKLEDGKRKHFTAHRLAFMFMEGSFPSNNLVVDHINQDRSDNRWCNLRAVNRAANSVNSSKFKNYTAVGNRFTSAITFKGKRHHLGTFDTAEEAQQAYTNAKEHHYGK